MHCVDLGESFPTSTSIYLQKSASIQPRTSLSGCGSYSIQLFLRLHQQGLAGAAAGFECPPGLRHHHLVVLVGHAAVRVHAEDAHELDDVELAAAVRVREVPEPREPVLRTPVSNFEK